MSRLLYDNPRFLLILIGLISVAGTTFYTTMSRMEDPILTKRFGIVRTVFPGADAQRVEFQVSRPLEDDIRRIDGIREIISESMAGISTVSIELEAEITDVDLVWSRVRDQISETAKSFPEAAFVPEFSEPELRAYAAITALKWTAPGEPNFAILRRLSDELENTIRSLPETESVDSFGHPEEEILVEVPPEVLDRLGITISELSQQIRDSESKGSAGVFRGKQSELVIELDQDIESLKRLGNTAIVYREGRERRLTRLSDIAAIGKRIQDPPASQALVDGRDAAVVAAFVRDEDRIDLWTRKLHKKLAAFRETLPPGVELRTLFLQNRYIQDRLSQLLMNLLIGTVAVVCVVFLLMGWRSMLVVGMALPLSAMMVLIGMNFLGIPIHQMSITGLIIALGLLIDNAIVMVDEVGTKLRTGAAPAEAILSTTRHLALPLFGSTLTTTLAFTPIAILPGATGEFVGSIAVSVILAINASFLLAMTIVPAATALSRRSTSGSPEGFLRRTGAQGISSELLTRWYRSFLIHFFRRPALGLILGITLPLIGFYQARHLPEQFFPPAERDQVHIEIEMPAGSSLAETRSTAVAIRERALEMDGISEVAWFLGESAPTFFYNMMTRRKNAPFYGQALVSLDDGVRSRDMIRDLQRSLDETFPHCRLLVRQLEQGPPFDAPVEVQLFGPDLAVLQRLGNEVRLIMAETSEVVHTRADLNEMVPKLAFRLDEYEAQLSQLTHRQIEQQLFTSLEGLESGSLIEETEEIPIRVRFADSARRNLGELASLELRPLPPTGAPHSGTPLGALGDLALDSEVAAIPRIDGRRVNMVKAYITAGTLPHLVLTEFQSKLAESDFHLPPGYSLAYGGEAAKRDQAVGNLMAYIPLIIALMLATLVIALRSFRVAFIIVLVGGLSIGLGFGALWLFDFPFGFMGVVGTMGLVGVAVNDAIVVMAGILASPEARAGREEAISEVVIRRTRHIVATTLTTIAGFTPLILGGGGFWPPVAITIAGGVAGATILALIFVPAAYLVISGDSEPPPLATKPSH